MGLWTPEEDARLIELVQKYGAKKWSRYAIEFTGRTGKQCRERYCFNLSPSISKEAWTDAEDLIIMRLFLIHGSKWSKMLGSLPGRTTNHIKNRYHSALKKRFINEEFDKEVMLT